MAIMSAIIGSDECSAMYNSVKSITTEACVLFGIEHVEKNIQLDNIHFPMNVQRVILDDIFGKTGLISHNKLTDFDAALPPRSQDLLAGGQIRGKVSRV